MGGDVSPEFFTGTNSRENVVKAFTLFLSISPLYLVTSAMTITSVSPTLALQV